MNLLALPFPPLDPVAFAVGPLVVRWYALAYILGLLLGWQLVRRLVSRPHWNLRADDADDMLFYATLGVILGGRIGYVLFYQLGHYLEHPMDVLAVWRGGMSFHGGLIGVLVALWLFSRQRGVHFLEVADAAAVVTPLGLLLGRIANFINGELWGRPTDVPWAVVFPAGGPVPRHPSQLYEAFLEGLVLFLVMQWLARRPWREEERGRLGGSFLTGYALARSFAEYFREPDPQLGFVFMSFTMGQLLCVPMLLAGLFLLARSRTATVRVPSG